MFVVRQCDNQTNIVCWRWRLFIHTVVFIQIPKQNGMKQNDERINFFANCGYVWINIILVRVCVCSRDIWDVGVFSLSRVYAQRTFDKWITFWFFMKKICVRIKLTKVSLNAAKKYTSDKKKRNETKKCKETNESKKKRKKKTIVGIKMKAWRVRWKSLWFKCRVQKGKK